MKMKKYVLLILMFMINLPVFSINSLFNEFEIRRINTNFNGSVYNGLSLLVYGEAGVILRSTNLGKDWEQIQINDSLNIIEMINIGSIYYGIASKKYIITSYDDGLNWYIKDFGDSSQFFRILNHSNKLYIILDKKIWVLNKSLEKIREYSFYSDSSYYDAAIVRNKLIYTAGKGKLGVIDLEYNSQDTIDLTQYNICKDCPVPTNLISNRTNLLYFLVNSNLYQLDFNKDSASFILKFTNKNINLFAYNDDIFHIYSNKNPLVLTDSIFFGILDKSTNRFKQINNPKVDRYILNTYINNLNFITKDILIAVGKSKLIYMSYNNGKTWELKSLFVGKNLKGIYLLDKLNIKMIEQKLRISYTCNGGITWLPSKTFNSIMEYDLISPDIKCFKDNNNGLFINSDYLIIDKNTAYTIDGGENLIFKNFDEIQSFMNEYPPLITVSNDDYLVVTHRNIDSNNYILFDFINKDIEIVKHTWTTGMEFYYIENIHDTIFAIGKNTKDVLNNRYYLYYSTDFASSWYEYFDFYIDTIQTYSGNIPLNKNPFRFSYRIKNYILSYCYYLTHNGDSSCYKIYLTDLNKKETKEIITLINSMVPTIFFMNNKYYLLYTHLVDKSNISELYSAYNIDYEPIDWHVERLQRYTDVGSFPTMIVSDSAVLFQAYDSLFKSETYYLAYPKKTNTVVEEPNIEEINSIYITTPVPIPVKSYTKMKIFYDQRLNIDQATFSVVNILGYEVSQKEEFQLTRINAYSCELIWRPQGLSPGVYILVVHIGDKTCSKVIILN